MLWAIFRCNRWMLEQADVVVAYVTRSWGGAAQFAARGARQKKWSSSWRNKNAIRAGECCESTGSYSSISSSKEYSFNS